MPSRRYIVQGRVQGVGFRWFVERKARALKLTGFVRNLDNGNVEVVAEGDEHALGQLRGELERGPVGSRVKHVDVAETAEHGFKDFEITY